MEKPAVLKAADLPSGTVSDLKALFNLHELPKNKDEADFVLKEHGRTIRAIALRKTIIDRAFLDSVPNLEIISSYSAGLDNVDVAEVNRRGIRLENTSHVLAEDVANAAMGLAYAVTRDLLQADAFVRSGTWLKQPQYRLGRSISRMTVGVVGLGTIGQALVRRLQATGASVVYHGPRPKSVDLPYYDSLEVLADHCDMLILTCPLTEATRHSVNEKVLAALGPSGYLVNVARGPVVDEAALIAALAQNRIAGAALDVFEHEPHVPDALLRDPRVVLTPHIGSATVETRQAMADNVVKVLAEYFGIATVSHAVAR